MNNNLNETSFEEHIAGQLAGSDLYNQRSSSDFDTENLCDREMLEQFLRQQPAVWEMLQRSFTGGNRQGGGGNQSPDKPGRELIDLVS